MTPQPTPPTPAPTADHGPWCSEANGDWWVVADSPADALAAIPEPDLFPPYYGWSVKLSRCSIKWADDYNGEEVCIEIAEPGHDEETCADAWHITWEGL